MSSRTVEHGKEVKRTESINVSCPAIARTQTELGSPVFFSVLLKNAQAFVPFDVLYKNEKTKTLMFLPKT